MKRTQHAPDTRPGLDGPTDGRLNHPPARSVARDSLPSSSFASSHCNVTTGIQVTLALAPATREPAGSLLRTQRVRRRHRCAGPRSRLPLPARQRRLPSRPSARPGGGPLPLNAASPGARCRPEAPAAARGAAEASWEGTPHPAAAAATARRCTIIGPCAVGETRSQPGSQTPPTATMLRACETHPCFATPPAAA